MAAVLSMGWEQVVALLDGDTSAEDALARVQRLCGWCVESTGTSGAALVISSGVHRSTVWATDEVAERLEELQVTFGEGPTVDALRVGRTVLAPHLCGGLASGGPVFGPAAVGVGARAVFAVPLRVGRIRAGVLSLYRSAAGEWDRLQGLAAQVCAEAATRLLCPDGMPRDPEAFAWVVDDRTRFQPRIHQAVGVLMVELGLAASDAYARLCAHAFATEVSIGHVAEEIVTGRVGLERDGDDRPQR